jgi:formylmethanofuran dehydrogenase subunit E-like metal-binding protein
MRDMTGLIEAATVQEAVCGPLYHGTAIFRPGGILATNALDGVQADGTSGISLTSESESARWIYKVSQLCENVFSLFRQRPVARSSPTGGISGGAAGTVS